MPATIDCILVALAHTPSVEHVVDYASTIAHGLGASLHLLHVYQPPNEMIGMVPGSTVSGETRAERDAGRALLERAAAIARARGIANVDRTVETAPSVYAAILARAHAEKVGLIVLGMHARKGMARIVAGSVARHVLRDAPCPVLLVPLPPEP